MERLTPQEEARVTAAIELSREQDAEIAINRCPNCNFRVMLAPRERRYYEKEIDMLEQQVCREQKHKIVELSVCYALGMIIGVGLTFWFVDAGIQYWW